MRILRPGDPGDLGRFVEAQERHPHPAILAELRRGRKDGHWIWYAFPQLRGLGRSPNAEFYGLASLAEARAFHAHPVLGPRLLACCRALLGHAGRDPLEVMGSAIDVRKLRSSMTLFARAAPGEPVFREVLERFLDGRPDPLTIELPGPGDDRG